MTPFYWFLIFVVVVWGGVFYFARGIISTLSTEAATHAKKYAPAYAKGAALILIASLTSFSETFEKISPDEAAVLSWWAWLSLFFKPVIAGLAVYVAFVDRSVQRAREDNKIEDKSKEPTDEKSP